MKKLILIFSMLLFTGLSFVTCDSDDNDDVTINYVSLPQTAKDFVSTHFPGVIANQTKKEAIPDSDGTLYEVYLSNGFEVDFDSNGNWTGIDGNNQLIPNSILALLPLSIIEYYTINYPNADIIEIDKKSYGYKIDLNNHIDLKFNTNGNFLGIDQ